MSYGVVARLLDGARRGVLGFFVVVFVGGLAFQSATTAHAGVFALISTIFSDESEVSPATSNVQNVALLQAALNYDPNPSKGGGDITIVGDSALLPDTGPLGTVSGSDTVGKATERISVYVVREGDSLSGIAKMFGVSTNTIIWANNLERGGIIRAGQMLVILPVSGVNYTVQKGDTIQSIAKKFKADADEIADFNELAEGVRLAVGDELIIPDGEIGAPAASITRPSSGGKVDMSGPSYAGYYVHPVPGSRRSQGLHGHNGVDLAAPVGTPVIASASGTVIVSREYGWNGGYGNYIVINHANGTQTLYAHNSRNIVVPGSSVVQGQVIGYVGSTGRSTGPHVHFEIRGAKNPF